MKLRSAQLALRRGPLQTDPRIESNRAAPGARASRGSHALACAGLVLAAVAAYADSFSGPFLFDDLLSIPRNPTIHGLFSSLSPPGGGETVTGRPLLNLSFALNYAVSGDHVRGYHVLNLLIHTLAGLALFGIIRRTLAGMPSRLAGRLAANLPDAESTFCAFAAALLWMIHPLQTESVTYIVQRAESLMGLFYLLALYCFIRGAEAQPDGRPPRGIADANCASPAGISGASVRWFALSVAACLLGMATKEVMVSAPVMVLLFDRTFVSGSFQGAWHRRARVHISLAATWIPLVALVLGNRNRGGSSGFGIGVSFWSYVATQFQALCHYLWLVIWPHPLVVDYWVKWVKTAGDVAPWAAAIALLIAVTCVAFFRRPMLGFLGIWFFAILSPTSLVPGNRQTLAEHRMYLALAPVIVLLILAVRKSLGRHGRLAVLAVTPALLALTAARNRTYRTDAAIWRDTVIKRPGNVPARNNYGNILARSGDLAGALAQYEQAMRVDPAFADSYFNAGNALKTLGRLTEAIASYERALTIRPQMPDAETALGTALEDAGRDDDAIAHYRRALKFDPDFAEAHNDLGLALARTGHPEAAVAEYRDALRINSSAADVHNNLGNALRAIGRPAEAIAQFNESLRFQPNYAPAYNNLGNVYRETNQLQQAAAQYEHALRIAPAVPEVRNNLGITLLLLGRTEDAIAQFEWALRLDPNLAQVHLNLGLALASIGHSGEAQAQFEAAKRLGASVPNLADLPNP